MAKLSVKVAKEPVTLAQGLMGVKKLADDEGMLFKFPMILEASFWGKDTYIPLDIAFIDGNNRITAIKDITPMSTRTVRSDGNCVMAIEANYGFFKKNNIKVGDEVIIVSSDDKTAEVSFKES